MTDGQDLFANYPMRWRYEHRGGWGYTSLVPCRILGRTAKRVRIAALRADGTEVERSVKPESLRTPDA